MKARMVSPEFFNDPDLGGLGSNERLIFLALILMADDYGRGLLDIRAIHHFVFGYRPDVSQGDTEQCVYNLFSALRSLIEYSIGGRRYYAIRSWEHWQKLYYRAKSPIPPPPGNILDSVNESRAADGRMAELVALWERNIGVITPMIYDAIKDSLEEFDELGMDGLWVVSKAIDTAAKSTTTPGWNYVRGILNNWKKDKRKAAAGTKEKLNEPMSKEEFNNAIDQPDRKRG